MPSSFTDPLYTRRSEIPYLMLPEHSEVWEDHNAGIVRRVACLWDDRQDFVLDFIGDAQKIASKLRRYLPEEDLEFSGFYAQRMQLVQYAGSAARDSTHKALRAVDRKYIGATADADVTSGVAFYDVTFRRPLYDLKTDEDADADALLERSRYIIRSGDDITGEAQPVYANWLEFEDKGEVGEYAPFIYARGAYSFVWAMVPEDAYPRQTAYQMQNTVNRDAFEGFAAQTLLFMGARTEKYQAANTRTYLNCQYQFLYRPDGWNKILRTTLTPPAFRRVRRKNDPDNGIYLEGSWERMFDPQYS
jgi:hypothetical protein